MNSSHLPQWKPYFFSFAPIKLLLVSRLKNKNYLKNKMKVLNTSCSRNVTIQRHRAFDCITEVASLQLSFLHHKTDKGTFCDFFTGYFGSAILDCLEAYNMHMLSILFITLGWLPLRAEGLLAGKQLYRFENKTWGSYWSTRWTRASSESL